MKCHWIRIEDQTDGCSWYRCGRCGSLARNCGSGDDRDFLDGIADCEAMTDGPAPLECDWESAGKRGTRAAHRCRRCGIVVVSNTDQPASEFLAGQRPCGEVMTQMRATTERRRRAQPQQGSKIARYSRAVAKWIAAGRPTRSDEEVARIYDDICRPCEHFTRKQSCELCGCRVRRSGSALMNKLAMGNQHCPIKRW